MNDKIKNYLDIDILANSICESELINNNINSNLIINLANMYRLDISELNKILIIKRRKYKLNKINENKI